MPIASRKQAWQGRKRPVPAMARGFIAPAPLGGINSVSGLANMAEDEAVVLVNLVPARYGCRVRTGYTRWQEIPLWGGTTVQEVRTVIPYSGSTENQSLDRLFVATKYGIYDASAKGVYALGVLTNPPTLEVTFATANASSGYGTFVHYTNDGGAHFLIYADSTNGLYQYSEATDTWARYHLDAAADPLHIQNVDPTTLTFVTSWKHRLWFGEANSSRAWYLGLGLLSGPATKFDFGNKFKYGGNLAGIYNWTITGGQGTDNALVAVSRAGDVAVYQGSDPDDALTFAMKALWYVGPVAKGNRVGTDFGGDLLLLTQNGVIPLSTLVNGAIPLMPQTYVTDKITNLVADTFAATVGLYGWEFRLNPKDDVLVITSPTISGGLPRQYVMDMASKKWAVQLGVPMSCTDVWRGEFYFGTLDGLLCTHAGDTDDIRLDGTAGEPIDFYTLTSFQNAGAPAVHKRVMFVRPVFTGSATPVFDVSIRYDYDTTVPAAVTGTVPAPASGWDVSLWDVGTWGGANVIYQRTSGVAGMGRVFAIALRGKTSSPLSLVSFEGTFDAGGFL